MTAVEMGLQELLEAHPGARVQGYCRWWEAEHGMQVSSATMSRAMHHLGWTRT